MQSPAFRFHFRFEEECQKGNVTEFNAREYFFGVTNSPFQKNPEHHEMRKVFII